MNPPIERTRAEYAALIPHPAPDANKYTRGAVLVVAGSHEYPGAAVLATAAARCGAGYTRLATPLSVSDIARCHLISIPVTACAERDGTFCLESVEDVVAAAGKVDAIVCGPGMKVTQDTIAFTAALFARLDLPMVIDADALNVVAQDPQIMDCRRGHVNVLTPHAGEAARLLGTKVVDPAADSVRLAKRFDATVVLKGPETHVASPTGEVIVCREGTAALAKAGSGDVLAGIIGSFLAQGLEALDAASLAVYLHGKAGRMAAAEVTDIAVMPEDLVQNIGSALVAIGA